MELYLHNGIADMRGPDFLQLQVILLAALLLFRSAVFSIARHLTPSPKVPQDMDPYQFAYLRGGDTELFGAVRFSLYQRGYLAEGSKISMTVAADHPSEYHLRPIEASVFEAYQSGKLPFSGGTSHVESFARQYDLELQGQGFLLEPGKWDLVRTTHRLSVALFGGLGLYKLTVALAKGHTKVSFLVMLTLVGVIMMLASAPSARLTTRGEKYLKELRIALEGYRAQLAQRSTQLTEEERALAEPRATLVMAVFGAGAFLATAYGDLFSSPAFASSRAISEGSSCGSSSSSCGSSSSSCGSSSSSCGGCGGGGCGGCGT